MKSSVESSRVHWFHGDSQERERWEHELITAGCLLPLRSRLAWARAFPEINNSLLVVEGENGARGAIAVERHQSRALPGHHVLRVFRAGTSVSPRVADAVIGALADFARRDSRALRLHLECFSRDAAVRDSLGAAASACGFELLSEVTNYELTLATDLRGQDNATHLASMSQGVRQNIRALAKYPVELRPIRDERDSARMNELMRETLARTGAAHIERDYAPIIRLAVAEPALARLMGLYRTDAAESGESLIAFALGLNNGDHAAYDIGASARVPEFKSLSLGYRLLWDLITWARDNGASWFDYGGVPKAESEGEEKLARISDFKRRFEKTVAHVTDEWVFAPHRVRSALADAISSAAGLVKRKSV
jgi:CelD/BcsL family acetyltransferase involved in cellulose biosynthesis